MRFIGNLCSPKSPNPPLAQVWLYSWRETKVCLQVFKKNLVLLLKSNADGDWKLNQMLNLCSRNFMTLPFRVNLLCLFSDKSWMIKYNFIMLFLGYFSTIVENGCYRKIKIPIKVDNTPGNSRTVVKIFKINEHECFHGFWCNSQSTASELREVNTGR